MDWDEGKNEHIKLADFAAAEYKEYGSTNSATQSYMRFEERTIREAAEALSKRERALDLGCGEGRISFLLSDLFGEVIGYDMSTEMVRAADRRKLRLSRGNTRFSVRDLELDLLPDIPSGSVDLVAASFGMGSFFQQTARLLREMHRVLRPAGKGILSFYNVRSLVHQLPLPETWQASLAAIVDDRSEHGLLVTFGDHRFDISARAYTVEDVLRMCHRHFRRCAAVTFPSISAVLPQTVSGHPRAIEVCEGIDRALAAAPGLDVGAYILATVTKGGGIGSMAVDEPTAYERLLRLLKKYDIKPYVKEHAPVQTMEDVFLQIDAPKERLLKSVLLRISPPETPSQFVLCVVAADVHVSLKKLASELDIPRRTIHLASQDEVESVTGFTVGALTALGMPREIPVILDHLVHEMSHDDDIWCGSGKRTESFRMPLATFLRLVGPSVRDISEATIRLESTDAV